MENEKVKILWDFNIFVDKLINARRPDSCHKEKSERMLYHRHSYIKRFSNKMKEKIEK